MLNAPQAVQDALNSGAFSFANLITVNLGDAYDHGADLIFRFTDCGHPVTVGGLVYSANNPLQEIDGISRKATTGQDKIDLTFSMTDEGLVSAINTGRYVGKESRIERVLLDSNGVVIGDYVIPARVARAVSHDMDADSAQITLSIDSVLGDLDGNNAWYCTEAGQQQRYPNDRIMRHAAAALEHDEGKPKYVVTPSGLIEQRAEPHSVPVLYGEQMVAPVLIGKLQYREPVSWFFNYFTIWVCVISAGSIESADLTSLRFDGASLSFDNNGYLNGDSAWALLVRKPEHSVLSIKDDPACAPFRKGMTDSQLNWLEGMHGHGLTVLLAAYRSIENYHDSNDFELPVRGIKCFDPRDNGTRYTRNPALQYYDYLTNADYGMGGRDLGVQADNIGELADHFDSLPGNEGGGIDAIEFDARVDTSEPFADCMDVWISGCKLYTTDYWGQMRLRVETISEPVLHIESSDCEAPATYESGDFTERPNSYTYITKQLIPDPDDETLEIEASVEATYPEPGSAVETQWRKEDGGRINSESKSLDHVNDVNQALYWAKHDAIDGRLNSELTLVPPPIAWLLEPGDVISYSDALLGLAGSTWRVKEVTEDGDETELTLKPYERAAYIPDLNIVPPPEPPAKVPKLSVMPPSSIRIAGAGQGLYRLSWQELSGSATWHQVDVHQVNDDGSQVLIHSNRVSSAVETVYLGISGKYVANITTGNNISEASAPYLVDLSKPLPPAEVVVSSDDTSITLCPVGSTGVYKFYRFLSLQQPTYVAMGNSYVAGGLTPNTQYDFAVRAAANSGDSDMIYLSVSTS